MHEVINEGMSEDGCRVVLWDASRPRLIDAKAAESLWRAGKVSGLFNLRTREQFAACRDFCVEASEGSRDAATGEAKELQNLRTRLADAEAENLILSERLEALEKQQNRMKRAPAMVDSLKSECQALKQSNSSLKSKLAAAERTITSQKDDLAFVIDVSDCCDVLSVIFCCSIAQ